MLFHRRLGRALSIHSISEAFPREGDSKSGKAVDCVNCVSSSVTMARKHSDVANHSIEIMNKNSTNHEIDAGLLKVHDLDTVLYKSQWAEDARIQSPVDPIGRVV